MRERGREREGEREREHISGGGAKKEGDTESEAGSRLWAVSTEPEVGLELTDREIMTRAEVGRLTDWATQVPLDFSIQQGSPVFNLKRVEQCKEGISVPDRQEASERGSCHFKWPQQSQHVWTGLQGLKDSHLWEITGSTKKIKQQNTVEDDGLSEKVRSALCCFRDQRKINGFQL